MEEKDLTAELAKVQAEIQLLALACRGVDRTFEDMLPKFADVFLSIADHLDDVAAKVGRLY